HLSVVGWHGGNKLIVRFMHPQTFGFPAFYPADEVDLVDPHSLRPLISAKVTTAEMTSPYEMSLELDRPIPTHIREAEAIALENVTWTPEVKITGCRFTLTPTRAILVSTRRHVEISDNEFIRIPMSSILIADDARSWYESGPVDGVDITGNRFIECSSPVISIHPEYDRYDGPVHRNISIVDNRFTGTYEKAVSARGVDGLDVFGNIFILPAGERLDSDALVTTEECINVNVSGNKLLD
ncbi:MAG: right-handed parallel beta-helix repeat-containing protein, partial [Muribaculaceae bacterium]|nr:right-handed parallel beta-helix repeat-containing protein [Muribaculaceae bacterium]